MQIGVNSALIPSIFLILCITIHFLQFTATEGYLFNEKVTDKCDKCNLSLCAPASLCNVGKVVDRCHCCEVCGLEEGHLCNTKEENWTNVWYGYCGISLMCTNVGSSWRCQCTLPGEVCASNDVTYSRCGMIAERMRSEGRIQAVSSGPCKTKPNINPFPKNFSIKSGEFANFYCEVEGHPLPVINWFYQSYGGSHDKKLPGDADDMVVTLRGGPKKRTATSILQIVKLDSSHEGTYKCQAENDQGFAFRNFNLTVM